MRKLLIQKKMAIKKKILSFPNYMSNDELRHNKKRIQNKITNIEDNHTYLQQNNIFQNSKENFVLDYIQELKRLKDIENNETNISSNLLNKKVFEKTLNNKKFFSLSHNRKELENSNKDTPSNLFDFIHPYEYQFSHKKAKIKDNSERKNTSEKSVKYLLLKNYNVKSKKINNIFKKKCNANIFEKKNNNNNRIFNLNKNNTNNININTSTSINYLLDKNFSSDINSSKTINNFNRKSSKELLKKFNKNILSDEKKNNENENSDIFKLEINECNDQNKSNIDAISLNKFNTELNINKNRMNDTEDFNINNTVSLSLPPNSPTHFLNREIQDTDDNKDHFLLKKNLLSETKRFRANTGKKKNFFISAANQVNRNSNYSSYRNRRILSTENSIKMGRKKKIELMKEIDSIDEELKNIQKDLFIKQDEEISEKFEKFKKKSKNDNIVTNILLESGRIKIISTMELFKKMNQKSFISELNRQYVTCKKGKYDTSIKKRFLEKLKKVDLMEKKEALQRDLAYKQNYDIRRGVNKLIEKELSKERIDFEKKTIKMKKLNANFIERFIKSMNKYKINKNK